ncbi:MAG: hypothetical protein R3Y64_09890 [Peptostreptococcaceae bacterium]
MKRELLIKKIKGRGFVGIETLDINTLSLVSKLLNKHCTRKTIDDLLFCRRSGFDLSALNNIRLNNHQIDEIVDGIKLGLNVKLYQSDLFNHLQMQEIKLGLKDGVDVHYANCKISFEEMKDIRLSCNT